MSKPRSISVKDATYDRITEMAARAGTTRRGLLERWINEALRREEAASAELDRESLVDQQG